MSKARSKLENAFIVAAIVCLVSLTCLFVQASFTVRAIGIKAQATLGSADKSLAKVAGDVDDLKVMLNATLFQIGDASHEVAETAREQKKYWDQTGQQTVLAMKQLNEVLVQVKTTTSSLNYDAQRISDSTVESLGQVQKTLASTQETLAASTSTINSMNQLISDQNIPETLAHVNETAANIQSTTARVDKEVETLMKPKSLLKSMLGFLLDTASKVAVIFK